MSRRGWRWLSPPRPLCRYFPAQFVEPLLHTTRPPVAEFEKDGEDFHFVSLERFEADLENGRFFHTRRDEGGNLEGVSFEAVDDVVSARKVPVLCLPIDSVRTA